VPTPKSNLSWRHVKMRCWLAWLHFRHGRRQPNRRHIFALDIENARTIGKQNLNVGFSMRRNVLRGIHNVARKTKVIHFRVLLLEKYASLVNDHKIVTTLCPGGKQRMRRLMELVRHGRLNLVPLLTHTFSLDDITEAYKLFGERREGVIKLAIKP
jgi:Zn-dependent alcohol dehydrogenase